MTDSGYTGTDNLEVMKEAVNYNRSLADLVKRYARKGDRILDFGAGVGTFAIALRQDGYAVECVEPDASQRAVIAAEGLNAYADISQVADATVDFIYTFNVLEHIDDDLQALRQVASKLRSGGKLLVYVPAFPLLYTSMDRKVGHVRRYKQRDLRAKVTACGLAVDAAEYVDSIGFFATLAYRFAGSDEGDIDRRALRVYDRYVFPVSRLTDRALNRWLGKNVLLVARKP